MNSFLFSYQCIGSASVALCFVARGYLNSYIMHDLNPWDVAPGSLLVTEAGGYISLDNGMPFDLSKGNIVASCDENINRGLVNIIRDADQKSLNIV